MYEGLKRWMNFSRFLLKWLGPFLHQYYMLDYSCVVCLEFIVCPRKDVTVLLEHVNEGLLLLWCAASIEIDIFRIFLSSQVDFLMRQCGTLGLGINGPPEVVLEIIQLFR